MNKQRTWAKWALIVFFAMMGILTFFSGTIRNLSLVQITTKPVTAGSITPVVSGAGMTEAEAVKEQLASRRGAVLERHAEPGDPVQAGDLLLSVEYLDDGTLAAKKAELEQQEKAYAEEQLNASLPSDSGAWADYQILKNNLEEAQERQSRCKEYLGKRKTLDSQLSSAEKELSQVQAAYHVGVDDAAAEAEAAQQALSAAQQRQQNAQTNYDYYAGFDPDSEDSAAAKTALEEANAAVLDCQNRCYAADTALQGLLAQYQPPVEAAREKLEALQEQSAALEQDYAGCTDETACENAVLSAKSSLSSYYDRQKSSQVQDERTAARLAEMEGQIEQTKQEIVALEAELGEKEIRAEADGVLERLFEQEVFEAEAVLAALQSTEAYSLRCSVSLTDAALLRLGAEARITNQNGGGSRAVLSAIEPDKTDPTNRKELVFTVSGDNAAAGQYLSLAIALETSKHDCVVPNAALYRDAVGSFVYVVETNTTPLGSRSRVRRVDVEELRRDDGYTAVSGELSTQDYVVILSSAPLSDGQAVRFGD